VQPPAPTVSQTKAPPMSIEHHSDQAELLGRIHLLVDLEPSTGQVGDRLKVACTLSLFRPMMLPLSTSGQHKGRSIVGVTKEARSRTRAPPVCSPALHKVS